jgi:hypothetical protein
VLLTEIETEVIKSFPFEDLYNFKKEAVSMLGYKHQVEIADEYGLFKGTVGRYLKSGKLFLGKYYILCSAIKLSN